MATKSKDDDDLSEPANDSGGAANIPAPPLKPFSKTGGHTPGKPLARTFRPEIPRRVGQIPGMPGLENYGTSLA